MTCEKCGFEYTGDTCPVCAAEEANKAAVAAEQKSNPLGLVGMILGIVGLATCDIALAIASLILASLSNKRCPGDPKAKVGKILSIITIILCAVVIVGAIALCALYIILVFVGGFGLAFLGSI